MNPGRFFMPNYMNPSFLQTSTPFLRANNIMSGRAGLFGKLTNSIRSVNWGNLLNNANKTLNVVNQTIPLVRQAGPMFNNMKSMLRIAKAFGNETTNTRNASMVHKQIEPSKKSDIVSSRSKDSNKKEDSFTNYPNFFI